MSALELSDVTLASVDADVLSCWESKVKLGLECSLILKHSKGKITTTLQFSKRRDLDVKTSTSSSSVSQAEKGKRKQKRRGGNAKKLERLLSYQEHLVKEKGLPPSRLMLQHAAVETSTTTAPIQEPGQVSGKNFSCDQCDFTSKSMRGLKVHIGRSHKDSQKPEVLREECDKSLNISHNSESIDEDSSLVEAAKKDTSSLAQAVLDGNRSEIDRVFDIIEATAKCQFCDYQCPNPRKVGFSGPPDIWDHIEEQHEREFDWFA